LLRLSINCAKIDEISLLWRVMDTKLRQNIRIISILACYKLDLTNLSFIFVALKQSDYE